MASDSNRKGEVAAAARVGRRKHAIYAVAFVLFAFLFWSRVLSVPARDEEMKQMVTRAVQGVDADNEMGKLRSKVAALEEELDQMKNGGQEKVWSEREKPEIALLTAYQGKTYSVMGLLSSQTKIKYASYHNYAYHLDNDLVNSRMNFNQKSASRIALFRRHWDDYKWLVWTDADVLITNPEKELEDLIEQFAPEGSGKHVIMSRDWGGRQVNPGVTLLRTSPEGKRFLDLWEEEIGLAQHHDDLLAIRDGIEQKKPPELNYLVFINQHEINSYPHLTLAHEEYNSKTVEHNPQHEFWKPGHLMVHVVNCLRQGGKIDSPCCDGIAAFYWSHFNTELENLLQQKHAALAPDFDLAKEARSDWTINFRSDLCLDAGQYP